MESVNIALHWNDLTLCRATLPNDHVKRGERVHCIMPEAAQKELLEMLFLCPLSQGCMESKTLWITQGERTLHAGGDEFCQHIACMLQHRGLLANLTLKENLLLPALYSDQKDVLQRAEQALPYVADFLDMQDKLHEKAGERPPYVHALMSLGHCLLKKPAIVVAQHMYTGMEEEYAKKFRRKMLRALKVWNPGVLYLSRSHVAQLTFPFDRTHILKCHKGMEWQ